MTSKQIRETFFHFFEERGHTRVPSAPIVPKNDPTLLFTNAGMNQFKDVFLGSGRRAYIRAVDTQKCLRVSGHHNDLEEVGISSQHHTFFEMLGNWSFGDYFKREAIAWAWELLTEVWKLPKERLWGTVFGGDSQEGIDADEEAERFWLDMTDLLPERLLRLGKADNFWEMGQTGPCGPCSEIHYFIGKDASTQPEIPNLNGPDYLEIWNLVFIQFNRDAENRLHPLPEKHVDTGMGLERICSILQGVESNYDTDLFLPIIEVIAKISQRDYDEDNQVAMRVIADHIRALTFAIADGAMPSNEGRGYVLRRILRRAARFGRNLGLKEPFIYRLVGTVSASVQGTFPEVSEEAEYVSRIIQSEEEAFGKTLDRGIEIFDEVCCKGQITGEEAFRLYDTYGFPLDLTQLMAEEKSVDVDVKGFKQKMSAQQLRSREAGRKVFAAQEMVEHDFLPDRHSKFVGYDTLKIESEVLAYRCVREGLLDLYLDVTPFYAESGGQVGDRGLLYNEWFEFQVEDTFRIGEGIVHRGRLVQGEFDRLKGIRLEAIVDQNWRLNVACNHTATHLLHRTLRRVLGDQVRQSGSLVASDRLRFDFNHFQGVERGQMEEIEGIVNELIRENVPIDISYTDIEQAREMGATMLFSEKYGDQVRLVRIGDFSIELCGGTHLSQTGQIGVFQLTSETGISAGIRRIEALTGIGAESKLRQGRSVLEELEKLLTLPLLDLPDKVSFLLSHNGELQRELKMLRRELAGLEMVRLIDQGIEIGENRVVVSKVQPADMEAFRDMADELLKVLGSGVGVLGAVLNGKVSVIAVVTDDLIERGVHAGLVVKEVAKGVGGSGGGRPHLAQAGGRHPERLGQSLELVPKIVQTQLEG